MIAFPDKKYKVIYADPPWAYRDKRERKGSGRICGGASTHYQTMGLGDIKALPIDSIADSDCILFMWATFPNLQDALDTMKAWGFKYKTLGFSWIKTSKSGDPSFGIGHYTRSNCEVCLIGTRGKPAIVNHAISSVVVAPRESHSKKPNAVRSKIVQLCGNVPRIELFARQRVSGWDAWGNEVSCESEG